jgi:hypothetical protein
MGREGGGADLSGINSGINERELKQDGQDRQDNSKCSRVVPRTSHPENPVHPVKYSPRSYLGAVFEAVPVPSIG